MTPFLSEARSKEEMELSKENALLADRLTIAARLRARGRMARMLASPRRMIYPKLMQLSGRTTEVAAETFWGERLQVILPELLSMNIWRYGFFEEDVCRFLLRMLRPGMTFIDIGAHFGFFTRLGAFLVGDGGRVLSFEPTPNTYRQLTRNTAGRGNIELHNCAAFSRATQLTLQDFGLEYSAFNSAFGIREDDAQKRRAAVEFQAVARRADDVIRKSGCADVHLIKIDAESSELHVLEGLETTLRRDHPRIILETGDFALDGVPKTAQLIAWLRDFGYAPFEIGRDNRLRPAQTKTFDFVGGNLLFSTAEEDAEV